MVRAVIGYVTLVLLRLIYTLFAVVVYQLHSVFYETFGVEKHDRVGKALNIELGDRLLNATFKEKQGSTLPLNLPDDTPFQELAFCRRVQVSKLNVYITVYKIYLFFFVYC